MATLTIYRLKTLALSQEDDLTGILSQDHVASEVGVRPTVPARLFLHRTRKERPEWTAYLRQLTSSTIRVSQGESLGALLIIWPYAGTNTVFAATWGTGHLLLRDSAAVRDFGLRAALNMASECEEGTSAPQFRSVKTRRRGETTLLSQIQATRKSDVGAFPISIDADQLRSVTLAPSNTDVWGVSVTGGASLHLRRPEIASRLIAFCQRLERAYSATSYKRRFSWIDNVKPVDDPSLLEKSVSRLIATLKSDDPSSIHIAPPEITTWEKVSQFEYHLGRKKQTVDEPSPESLVTFLKHNAAFDPLSQELLTDQLRISTIDEDGIRSDTWSALRCMDFEFSLSSRSWVLENGTLFAVDRDYLSTLNTFIRSIGKSGLTLPPTSAHQREDAYNETLASRLPASVLLDGKTVTRPDGDAVEICDVARSTGALIHVKRGVSSSTLSHLFSQGVVSAELLLLDSAFSSKAKERLSTECSVARLPLARFKRFYAQPFIPSDCVVNYVILTERRYSMPTKDLPFFSKVNLRLRCHDLKRLQITYTLDLVRQQ